MKRIYGIILIVAACMVGPSVAPAEPPLDPPPPPPQHSPDGARHGPGRGRSVERWLGHMERERPEEFAEMQRLREEDPEEFQRRMRSRRDQLRQRNVQATLADIPRLNEFLAGLPEKERNDIVGRLGRMYGPERRGQHPDRGPDRNPKVREFTREIDALAAQYREADKPQRKQLKQEIRQRLEASFDLAESDRQEHIQRAEERLETLKDSLRTRSENREEIIARRLEEMTGGKVP